MIFVAGSGHDPPGTRPRFTRQDGKSHRATTATTPAAYGGRAPGRAARGASVSQSRGDRPPSRTPTSPLPRTHQQGRAQAVNAMEERLRRRAGRWGSREVQRSHQLRDVGHTNIAAGLRTTALPPLRAAAGPARPQLTCANARSKDSTITLGTRVGPNGMRRYRDPVLSTLRRYGWKASEGRPLLGARRTAVLAESSEVRSRTLLSGSRCRWPPGIR